MGMNFSRIFGGLFGKKEMRAYSFAVFCHVTPTFSILTLLFRHSYGNAHLLAPHERFLNSGY